MHRIHSFIPSLAVALVLSLSAAPAFAAFTGPGSAGGKGAPAAQAAQLTKAVQTTSAADDTPCLLEGNLVERAGRKNAYVFKDDSGTVTVKISGKQFRNRNIGPENRVRLSGEVDSKAGRPSVVDVDWIEVIK